MADDNGIAGTGIKLGITLYSLTSEFAAGLYTPETLIKAAADEGLGPGIEFNIAQMLRTYPDVDADFASMMIAHHEGAVLMANMALERSQRDEIRTLARAIVAAQEDEIARMKPFAG